MSDRRFTFRLERVRALREREEDLAREHLAAAMLVRQDGQMRLEAAVRRLSGENAVQRATSPATGNDLVGAQAYLEHLQQTREAAALELDRREAEVEARHGALVQAARGRQVLERLKDRRHAEHAAEAARRESAELDEMALVVHRRGGRA